ncbi:MAG: hypothetical protein EHM79_16175 [Geobacter sp.]|nr:MAG: hypothetical protein EHM79_16175 [Geobacter sp.]
MKRLWRIIPMLGLAGCSLFTANAPFPLKETSPANVKDCRKVAKFPGPSGYRMWGPPAALGSFKYDTAKKAKEMGATHIYWGEDLDGLEGGIVGYAVDCTGVLVDTGENGFAE